MLLFVYSALFLALAATLLRRQATRYEREHALVPQRVRQDRRRP